MMRTILIPLVSILLFFVQFPVRSDTVTVAGGLFPCVSELADLYNDMAGEAPGLVGGIALAAARALGDFGLTLMIAGNIPGRTQTLPLSTLFRIRNNVDYPEVLEMPKFMRFFFPLKEIALKTSA